MIEVFKTNITDQAVACLLLQLIKSHFDNYTVNFDLHDCDRILRVKSPGRINTAALISLLAANGYQAAVLTEEIPPLRSIAAVPLHAVMYAYAGQQSGNREVHRSYDSFSTLQTLN